MATEAKKTNIIFSAMLQKLKRMKKGTMMLTFFALGILCGEGQDLGNRRLHFSIHTAGSAVLQDKLDVYFWRDFIYQSRFDEANVLQVSPNADNTYSFSLPPITTLGRIVVSSSTLGEVISYGIVEPGDSIIAAAAPDEAGDIRTVFSGRGSKKYNFCTQIGLQLGAMMQSINGWTRAEENLGPPLRMFAVKDSLLSLYGHQLALDREINPAVKAVIARDIYGVLHLRLVSYLAYHYSRATGTPKSDLGALLDKALTSGDMTPADTSALSKSCIEFLVERAKLKLTKQKDPDFTTDDLYTTRIITFKNLYDELKTHFNGALREQLLAYCITDFWTIDVFFGGTDAEQYTDCMRDAAGLFRDPFRKSVIEKQLMTLGKGAAAFDFALPDSTGRMFRLADFRNKIVLVDMWSNPCRGCKEFGREFDRVIYPHIKNNPDFAVLSINLNSDRAKWLQGVKTYSRPDYINLGVGDLGFDHPMVKHYSITGVPKLLLIDRDGKILSATVPFFNRYQDLLELLQEALHQ